MGDMRLFIINVAVLIQKTGGPAMGTAENLKNALS